jgi:hypothetical protein
VSEKRNAALRGRVQLAEKQLLTAEFSNFPGSNACRFVGVFCRKLHLPEFGVDTIASVSVQHKPLQVVCSVKNKKLLSSPFLTGSVAYW